MFVVILAIISLGLLSATAAFLYFWDKENFPRFFLGMAGVVLAGYALFGRGFAYTGFPPVFVGELLMMLGIASVFFSSLWILLFRSKVLILVLVLIFWGAVCTLPYLGTYGLDALRDAVLWGYSFFAIMVFVCLLRFPDIDVWINRYWKLIPIFLLVMPVAGLAMRFGSHLIPSHLGSDVGIIHIKSGDASVHLAGVATFFLLGVQNFKGRRGRNSIPYLAFLIFMVLWMFSFLIFATTNRGGLLSIACAMLVALPFIPIRRGMRVGLAIVVLFFALTTFSFEVESGKRSISADQVILNFKSIFVSDPSDTSGLSGTREWRLLWWTHIVEYTVYGEYFWTGKGYGINLGVDDGFRGEDGGTRSPHNGHLSVLARSGVPGLAIWVLVQVSFSLAMLQGILKARARGDRRWLLLNAWILAYWTAFMVNGSFDVFFEGPQGGIWFWSLIGFGLAALEIQKRETATMNGSNGGAGKRAGALDRSPEGGSSPWQRHEERKRPRVLVPATEEAN